MSQAENILQQTLDFITSTFVGDVENVSEYLTKAIESNKESLEQLLEARTQNLISKLEFEFELQRELMVFKTQLLTTSLMTKATINKICDVAFKQIVKLVVNPIA
ncbi:hypothetical protein QL989_03645 [Pseudoalteromonas sp. APC 3224]|uniref:hypothetical protein n=1 Tax=Pseudoalteromonas sp. APC 3224 TaxID=3035203 RepID=UPI0025B3EE94|nr:hypothetical protein [Pseudoalteromonas sp. APC 3224]MDN3484435.1 hypothetical protein [Pseudoalteromonas sp. APC 3224]